MATTMQQEIVENRAQILKEDEERSKGGLGDARATSRPAHPKALEAMEKAADLFPRRARARDSRTNLMDEPSAAGGLGSLKAQQARDERVVASGLPSAAPGPASERQADAAVDTTTPGDVNPSMPTKAQAEAAQEEGQGDGKAPGETTTKTEPTTSTPVTPPVTNQAPPSGPAKTDDKPPK